jgi:hypothetical protein
MKLLSLAGACAALASAALAGCGGSGSGSSGNAATGGNGSNGTGSTGSTGSGGMGGHGSSSTGGGGNGTPAGVASAGCADIFDQSQVHTFSIDISPSEMSSIQAEFNDIATLEAKGNDFVSRHPVTFHYGSETVADATLKLHGQSSWAQAVMFDGDKAKMQFDISFHQSDANKKFHGVEKLVFDMPRDDWTFLHDRVAHAWFRQVGIAAGCVASAHVEINGSYYGLFSVEENTNKRILKEFFPNYTTGGLWKAANQPETGTTNDSDRLQQFKSASDFASVAAIVDLPSSVMEWAGEALISDSDGYYGGNHNFYIYDQGTAGFVFLPNDTDSTFEWMTLFDNVGAQDDPVNWWQGRALPPKPDHVWTIAMSDPATVKMYRDAIATQLGNWDVQQIQGWIDTWSQQIAADVAADPHTPVTTANFQSAVSAMRDEVAQRAAFLQGWVASH